MTSLLQLQPRKAFLVKNYLKEENLETNVADVINDKIEVEEVEEIDIDLIQRGKWKH